MPGRFPKVRPRHAVRHTARTVALILRDLRIEGLLPAGPPGARVDFLRHVVTHSARPQGDGEFHRTWGLGKPDHGKARDLARRLVQENLVSAIIGERIGAAAQTTVFIEALGGTADRRGLALVEVRAPDGRPLANARLHGDWEGATRGAAECLTDGWGRCLLATPAITDSALADSAGLLVGLTLHRALAADGRALAIRPADRYDATRAATLGDTAITLERITAADPLDPDTLDSETLALLALRDPLTDQPLYCLGRDCPGFTLALGDPGDLFRIGHRRIYLVTRYPGGTPGPDSLLAGRTLTPSYQYRRHGRELQGGGLTLAFDEAFHATARDALGDDMHPIDDGIRLGSTGPGEPLIWVNDLTADVIVEGTGMMISGLTPIEYSFKFWGATLFYAINVQGTGMMISGLSVKFRSTGDFFSYNLAAIGSAWKTYGSALLDSTHPPFVFLGLGDP